MVQDATNGIKSKRYLIAAVLSCNLAAFTCGIFLTWTSPVFPKINNSTGTNENNPFDNPINNDEQSWIGSLLAMGAIFGPFLAGLLADRIGRKNTLIYAAGIPFIATFLILAFAKTPILYYVARFLGGFALGIIFTTSPMYLGEISEASVRGTVASTFNIFIVSGELLSYCLGPYVSILVFSIICAVFPVLLVISFFFFMDSPHYFIAKKDFSSAEQSLMKLRNSSKKGVEKELQAIKENVEKDIQNKGTILDVFKNKGLRRALLICLGLGTLQQLSGINVVLFYVTDTFNATGSSIDSDLSSIIVGVVQFFTSFSTPLLVDRLGRKMLFLISAIGMLISQVPLGVYFYLQENGRDVSAIGWLPIICMIAYIITYNFGFGPLPWTVMGEIFPADVKAAASTVTASVCWLMGFIVTKTFSNLTQACGTGPTYWIFSAFCFIAIFFVTFFMIETKGKTFDEIQQELNKIK